MIKKQRTIFLLVALLVTHGELAYGSLAALNTALDINEAAVKAVCTQYPEFCAKPGQRTRILAKFPTIFDVAPASSGGATRSGGGGGPVLLPTQVVIDVMKPIDEAILTGNKPAVIALFNAASNSTASPQFLATLYGLTQRIYNAFNITPVTTNGIAQFTVPTPVVQILPGPPAPLIIPGLLKPPSPIKTIVTEPDPNLIKYQKQLLGLVKTFNEKTGGASALDKDKLQSIMITASTFPETVISTLNTLLLMIITIDPSMRILDPNVQPKIDALDAKIKKIEIDFKNTHKKPTQVDTDKMKTGYRNLQNEIEELNKNAYTDSPDLTALKALITLVINALKNLPKLPTLYSSCTYEVPGFIADATNYEALKKAFNDWKLKLNSTANKDQKSALTTLETNFKEFFTGIETYKTAYIPLSFLFDSSNAKCKTMFQTDNAAILGNIKGLETAKLNAESAYDDTLKRFQSLYDNFLRTNPTSSEADLKAECKKLDEDSTKQGTLIPTMFPLFKEALDKYVSPLDSEIEPLVDLLNGITAATNIVALLEAPAPITATTGLAFIIYTAALDKYNTQQSEISSGKLVIVKDSTGKDVVKMAATTPKGSALEQLKPVILKDKTIGLIQNARTFFEGFEKKYTTSTTTQTFKTFLCAILPPVPNGWVPQETNITLVVGQDQISGAFSVPPINYPAINKTPPSPFIVSQEISISRPLVMVEVDGKSASDPSDPVTNEVKAIIGFLKKGYETETATVSRDLGIWKTLLSNTVTDEPLPNSTGGYDLYLWTQTVAECPATQSTANYSNLHRLYTAKVQIKKIDKSSGDFMIRFNDNCLPKPSVKANTSLYKLYSFDQSKSSKNDKGASIKHKEYEGIPKSDGMPYPDRLYNTMINKLRSLLGRTTPKPVVAAAAPVAP